MRLISDVAADIRRDWKNPYFGAKPYLAAMSSLSDKHSRYIAEDATSIVLYFLSNASTYRGENARKFKAELKEIIK